MNVQNILKRTALSALMFSAVAAPAVTNADSSKSETPVAKTQAAIAISTADGKNVQNMVMIKISDPLALAKKYAPETVEDWQKTLEQFGKTFASEMTKDVIAGKAESLKSVPAEKLNFSLEKTKDISGDKAVTYVLATPTTDANMTVKLTPSTAILQDDFTVAVPAASLTESKESAKPDTIAFSVSTAPAKEVDTAFAKAWTALTQADEANDAEAIKKALAELLTQYKQQIAEKEAAAK